MNAMPVRDAFLNPIIPKFWDKACTQRIVCISYNESRDKFAVFRNGRFRGVKPDQLLYLKPEIAPTNNP